MRRLVATLALLAATSAGALVLTDVSRSLWDLSQEADLIALATVVRLHWGVVAPTTYVSAAEVAGGPRTSPTGLNLGWARLRIDEVVAGPAVAEVDVSFWVGMSDPSPPNLPVGQQGEQVLVFLTRHGSTWVVEGGPYGALHPSPADLPRFLERTRAARALLVRGAVTAAERLEWLLATAESRVTRWHGLFGLQDVGPRDGDGPLPGRALPRLSAQQLDRLARAFIAEPSTDETLPMMLEVLQPVKDSGLDRAVVRALDEALANGEPYRDQLRPALELSLRRFASEAEVQELVPRFENTDRPDRAELEAAWKRAKAKLVLPTP